MLSRQVFDRPARQAAHHHRFRMQRDTRFKVKPPTFPLNASLTIVGLDMLGQVAFADLDVIDRRTSPAWGACAGDVRRQACNRLALRPSQAVRIVFSSWRAIAGTRLQYVGQATFGRDRRPSRRPELRHGVHGAANQAGKMKPLAVASQRRSEALPDTPTWEELGFPT